LDHEDGRSETAIKTRVRMANDAFSKRKELSIPEGFVIRNAPGN